MITTVLYTICHFHINIVNAVHVGRFYQPYATSYDILEEMRLYHLDHLYHEISCNMQGLHLCR